MICKSKRFFGCGSHFSLLCSEFFANWFCFTNSNPGSICIQQLFCSLTASLDQGDGSECWYTSLEYIMAWIHHWVAIEKWLTWKGFEPIATEFCLDTLTDWDCYQAWVQLTSEPTLYSYFNVICSVLYLILAIDFVLAILAIVFIDYRISRSLGSWP